MVKTITINEPFLATQCVLGEGPVWDSKKGILYFIDIKKAEIHALDPKSMSHAIDTYKNQTPTLGCFALSADGSSLIVAEATRLVKASPPTLPSSSPAPGEKVEVKEKKGEEIGFEIPERFTKDKVNGTERLNDGACDAKGRFWVGSTGYKEPNGGGQLFRFDKDGSINVMEERICCSNGLGWSPDNKTLYYIDSPLCIIWAYDFDLESGNITNRRIFADSQPFHGGTYDGLCMDAEGGIWACRWGDSKVVRFLPDGTIDMIVEIPKALHVTCCVFGGDDMQDLFITTASCTVTKPELQPDFPQSGDLFKVRIEGIKGVERHRWHS